MLSRKTKLFAAAGAMILLAGCATRPQGPNAFDHYDACAKQHANFVDMAACGKKAREAYCKKLSSSSSWAIGFNATPIIPRCTAAGDTVVQYADTLSASVKGKEMTNLQAQKRWIEFKAEQQNAWAAEQAASRSKRLRTTCTGSGNQINCDTY